jgi:hypothetical protein
MMNGQEHLTRASDIIELTACPVDSSDTIAQDVELEFIDPSLTEY